MIGLDTNILARYLAQDDAKQSAQASRLVEGLTEDDPGFVCIPVLVELHWVLTRAYDVSPEHAADVTRRLLASREIVVERADCVHRSIGRVTEGVDFADALIAELGRVAGCDTTMTFDRTAARSGVMALVR